MKKKNTILFWIATVLAVFNLLLYFALRPMWSGIIAIAGHPSAYIILAIILVLALASCVLLYYKATFLIISIPLLVGDLFFFGLEAYIISQTIEAYLYFVRDFLDGALVVVVILLIGNLVFVFPKTKLYKYKWIRPVSLLVIFFGFVIYRFGLVPNHFTSTPVVYAVEDEYQIVYTTSAKGTAWVQVGDQTYYDTYAGYMDSEKTVHKIIVPMSSLDEAKSYTIYSRSMLLRGPYCALQGSTISKQYNWRGVDDSDGLNYYVLSDTHNNLKCPTKAGTYFGEKLDFLIHCGDSVSWNDEEEDLSNILQLCGSITGGQVPVVYARGNHETKGVLADQFYQYVASKDQKFYYTFRLGKIWGVVLDTGDDHADDFIEFSGLAKFNDYRKEQITFLDSVIANSDSEYEAPGIEYRIAVFHIPVTIKYKNDYAGEAKDEWIKRLNQMHLTMSFCGHSHELMYVDPSFEAGSELVQCYEYSNKKTKNAIRYMTDADFPSILVSKKSTGQQLRYGTTVFDTHFIGLAVTADRETTTMQYTNEDHNIIENLISPWFSDIQYGDRITVPNIP